MINVQITNLRPSDIVYLKSALDDPKIRDEMLEKLSKVVSGSDVCIQSLDNIFCAAAALNACQFAQKVSVENLDAVFNAKSANSERVHAFVEGLGRNYDGSIKLTPEQRKFRR